MTVQYVCYWYKTTAMLIIVLFPRWGMMMIKINGIKVFCKQLMIWIYVSGLAGTSSGHIGYYSSKGGSQEVASSLFSPKPQCLSEPNQRVMTVRWRSGTFVTDLTVNCCETVAVCFGLSTRTTQLGSGKDPGLGRRPVFDPSNHLTLPPLLTTLEGYHRL